jgi:hypothetical protein
VNRDEIYLASFPFGDSAGMKLRPVLLSTGPVGSVPEVLVAYISSVIPPVLLPSDIMLDPRVLLHFRQFLLWNQERGEFCKKSATVGVNTPGNRRIRHSRPTSPPSLSA